MLCWSRFNNIKTADWMFIAGGSLIRLNKKACARGLFQRWEAEMAEVGAFERVADSPPRSWPTAMPLLSTVVHGNTAPALGDPRSSLPSCVCVRGANLRPCLLHVWLLLSDTPDVLEELWGSGLCFFFRWSTGAQLHLNSWKSPRLAGMSILFL